MLDFKRGTTVQDIINDGEYNSDVKAHFKHEAQYNDALLARILEDWMTDLRTVGSSLIEQFYGLTTEEAIRWMDLDEVLDFYEEEGNLTDFVQGYDIDWRGLAETFGIE